MSKLPRKRIKGKNQSVQTLKQRLVFLISFLGASVTVLILGVGVQWWPVWMVDYRSRLIGIFLFALVFVVLLSPLILESSKRPRDFPGPGKNPYIDP